MSEDADISELLALLDDEYARAILTETSVEPMSASILSDRCEASLPTVYRRLERLQKCDLISEQTTLAPDGNHYSVYEARLEGLEVTLDDGELTLEVRRRDEDVADKFTRLWEGMR
ncbi:winged helix-turn-helix domain-containing protein [Halobacteria archaeon AArc-curdl1]|uniref:Winged helix-turn-helix domain-containing protein n=1 Tax=Natronosalvus hydrolyticus TaxID=2979988 RepID=A0AAP2ZED1_9EURY|nr:winged helix-turn-helix domain-containing protein [Halobacteria archaeon AArc-curdl1]